MKLNIFERKQLNQINKTDRLLNEGLGDKIFKWMYGRKFKKIMKGIKEEDDFPEYQSILKNLKQQFEDIEARYEESEKVLAQAKEEEKRLKRRVKALSRITGD
jgi:hypothetical protein